MVIAGLKLCMISSLLAMLFDAGKVRLTLLSQIGSGVYDISCEEILLRASLEYLVALNND
jgi:hypothetical protein